MNLHALINSGQRAVKSNAPSILTGVGVAGTVSTAILAAKGAFKAASHIRADEKDAGTASDPKEREYAFLENENPKDRFLRRAKLTWRCYIPAASSGVVTVAAIIGSNKVNAQRTAAAITAYSLTETAFIEYKDQVIKQIGKTKEQAIRDQVATERVAKTAPPAGSIVVAGSGNVMCCELHTGRYFMSTMEKLRRAQNDVNAQINQQLYVTLDELYDILDVPHTSTSSNMGWTSEHGLLDMSFSSVLTPDGIPCIAFEYNYLKPI